MTPEDFLIAQRNTAAVAAMVDGDRVDAALMAMLGDPCLGRATLAPATLASIGLDGDEFKAIALGLPLPSDTIVTEHSMDEFEHVELCTHGRDMDHVCEDCEIERAEHNQVPAEWFAGGFADNH